MEFFNTLNIHEHAMTHFHSGVIHASNITFPFYISPPGLLVRFGTDD